SCRRIGLPLYGELMRLLGMVWSDARDPSFREKLSPLWRRRAIAVWYERPLLLALALHERALRVGLLRKEDATCGGGPSALGRQLLKGAQAELFADAESVALPRTGFVETNETSRGVVWRWPLAELAAKLPSEVLRFDLGASAGLNLVADAL